MSLYNFSHDGVDIAGCELVNGTQGQQCAMAISYWKEVCSTRCAQMNVLVCADINCYSFPFISGWFRGHYMSSNGDPWCIATIKEEQPMKARVRMQRDLVGE
jgi:hypothetical protein